MESAGALATPIEDFRPATWWRRRRRELLAIARQGTPAYVYDLEVVRERARRLRKLEPVRRLFYAVKANAHPAVLRVLAEEGFGFECVSAGELTLLQEALPTLPGGRILFTPNFAPRAEYEQAVRMGAWITLDGLHPLEAWGEALAGARLLLRVDPGRGAGHHRAVTTAGPSTKFGMEPEQAEQALALARHHGLSVVGLHCHVGSGISDPLVWEEAAAPLLPILQRWPGLRVLDLGGGLAVPATEADDDFDLAGLARVLGRVRPQVPRAEIWLEPGRYLVAEAGVLLARVTQTKSKGGEHYTGIDAGMNTLLRPALYGARHPVEVLSARPGSGVRQTHLVGPICESADFLGRCLSLPPAREGDVMLIGCAGAYGRVMASSYNGRAPAREVVMGISGIQCE